MSFTLLFTDRNEMRALETAGFFDALVNAKELVQNGAQDVSIIDPDGQTAVRHQQILDLVEHHESQAECASGGDPDAGTL